MDARAIIHLNVADFAVAVERVLDARLRERPVVIAPEGALRAAVFDMSDEAFQHGVRKGMALARARRLCRDVVVIAPHQDRYEQAMRDLLARALPYSPLIEMTDSNGHLFIDSTGTSRLFGPAYDVAWRIRKAVRNELGLDPIWSVAHNKLLAKVATRVVKPAGEYILEEGQEGAFLAPLPVALLPGLDGDDLGRLREFRLDRVGQVRAWTLPQLEVVFAGHGQLIYESARGIDGSPVLPVGRERPEIALDHAFGNDSNDLATLHAALFALVEQAGRKLRQRRLAAQRLGIVLDYSDGMRTARQGSVVPASANDQRLFAAAQQVLDRAFARRVRIRHLHLHLDRLTFPPAQLDLFEERRQPTNERLLQSLDAIRGKFGVGAVRYARGDAMEDAEHGVGAVRYGRGNAMEDTENGGERRGGGVVAGAIPPRPAKRGEGRGEGLPAKRGEVV
jgi:DNA polymerase-4